jgi:hypothetical protein
VDLGGLGVSVLLAVEEVTKHAYGEMAEATPENTVAFLAHLVAEFPQKIDAVSTDICPAFAHVREAFDRGRVGRGTLGALDHSQILRTPMLKQLEDIIETADKRLDELSVSEQERNSALAAYRMERDQKD